VHRERWRRSIGAVNVDVHFALRMNLLAAEKDKTWKLRPGELASSHLLGTAEPLVCVFRDVVVGTGVRIIDDVENVSETVDVLDVKELARDLREGLVNGKFVADEVEHLHSVTPPAATLSFSLGTRSGDENGVLDSAVDLGKVGRKVYEASRKVANLPGAFSADVGRN